MAAIVRLLLMIPIVFASAGTIDGSHRYAWGENVGWIDFGSAEGGVVINDDYLTGYAWGENIGWISLNCSNTDSCNAVSYYVHNTSSGQLSGYAWGENTGWINFSPGFDVNPRINVTTGQFTGYAWGENTGWINFNCSNTNDCSNVNYYLAAIWTPTSSGGGGSAPGSSPATPAPLMSQTPGASSVPDVSGTPVASSVPAATVSPVSTATPYTSPPSVPPSNIEPTSLPDSENTSTFGDFIKSIPGKISNAYKEAIKPVIRVIPSIAEKVSKPISIATSLGVAVSTAASAVSVATSGISFLTYIEFFLKNLLVFFGLKKKARAWGTVYNSITQQPLAYTKVQLLGKDSRVLETRMTDREGRYGFLINTGSIGQYDVVDLQIKPIRDDFQFPSKKVTGDSDLILYPKIYNGGIVQVRTKELVKFDIPMDPIRQSAIIQKIRVPSAMLHNLWVNFSHLMFWIALVAVPVNYIIYPTFVNLIMLIVFMGLNLLIFVGDLEQRPYGVVVDREGENPIPYSLITLNDKENGDRRGFTVSDGRGRYFMLSKKGDFRINAYTPAQIVPSRSTEENITVDRGWIAKKLNL